MQVQPLVPLRSICHRAFGIDPRRSSACAIDAGAADSALCDRVAGGRSGRGRVSVAALLSALLRRGLVQPPTAIAAPASSSIRNFFDVIDPSFSLRKDGRLNTIPASAHERRALDLRAALCHAPAMTIARISELERKTTQSGKANTGRWLLEFERQQALRPDPLTGWNGSGDTNPQVRLTFPTQGRGDRLLRQARPRLPSRPGAAGPAQDPGLRRQFPLSCSLRSSIVEANCSRRARGKAAFRRYQAGDRHQARSDQACARRRRAGRARHCADACPDRPAPRPRPARLRAWRLSAHAARLPGRGGPAPPRPQRHRRVAPAARRAARPAGRPGRYVERARRARSRLSPPASPSRMSRPGFGPTTRGCPGPRRNIARRSTPGRDLLFAPTEVAAANLRAEGVSGESM